MKRIHIILLLALSLFSEKTHAQFIGNFVEDRICSGADGNYIFLVDEKYMMEHNGLFPEPYQNGRFFLIERSVNDGAFVVIDTLKPIQSSTELEAIFGEGTIQAILEDKVNYSFQSEAEIIKAYQSSNSPFSFLFLQPVKQLRAMGHAYVDLDVEEGNKYTYRVKWNDTGESIVTGSTSFGASNKMLDKVKLRFNQMSISSLDSLITGGWLQTGIENKMAFEVDFYGKKTFDKKFEKLYTKRMFYAADTVKASIFHRVNPMEVWDVFAVPVDLLGNRGTPSDTATIAAFTKGRLPYPKNFTAKDSTNAIYLTWEPVTEHSYVSGYLLSREIGNRVYAILDTIPLNQNYYLDYDVENGQSYNYDLQVISSPINNLIYKDFPSVKAAGSHTTSERILPPAKLTLSHVGPYIRIDWEPVDETNLMNYFVYSSLTPDAETFETVGSSRDSTSLIDSTLNGDFQHQTRYYGIKSMSYNMKLSQLSTIASIQPKFETEIEKPIGLNVKRWASGNKLTWETREMSSNFISSYNIYRRASALEPFFVIDSLIKVPEYLDEAAIPELAYEYAISAMGINEKESPVSVSQIIEGFNAIHEEDNHLSRVSYKNIPPGIEINWLWPNNADIEKIVIYKMLANTATEQEFQKVAEVDVEKSRFWDKDVKVGETYAYQISVKDNSGRESTRKFAKIISRRIQKD